MGGWGQEGWWQQDPGSQELLRPGRGEAEKAWAGLWLVAGRVGQLGCKGWEANCGEKGW